MKFKYTHMLTLAILTTLSLSASEQQDKQIFLSAVEVQEIYDNPTRSYVYVGRDVSNLADIIAEISKLETDENSPVRALDAHIQKGFVIGNYDGVAQALEHAEAVLNEADPKRETELSQALNAIIEQVDAEQLNIDAAMLEAANVQAPEARACGTCDSHCLRRLVVKEKVEFLNDVKFRDDVTFYDDVRFRDNVRIDGSLSVNDVIINFTNGNTNLGISSLGANTTGINNTAIGFQTLNANTTGANNTALGFNALPDVTSGLDNIAIGFNAGTGLTTGSTNIYIGAVALTAGESNVTRISGIRGATTGVADAVAVLIDSTGQLGTINSSKAVKHNIQSMNDVSANIYDLNPVTFVYNSDASETTQYGLIAEEVADVFPGIVVRNANGQPETVQYHVLPILTLNELQKLAARVAVLEAHLMN